MKPELDIGIFYTLHMLLIDAEIRKESTARVTIEVTGYLEKALKYVNYCLVKNRITNKNEIFLNLYTEIIKEFANDTVLVKAVPTYRFFVENEKLYCEKMYEGRFITNERLSEISKMYSYEMNLYDLMSMARTSITNNHLILESDLQFIKRVLTKQIDLNLIEQKTVEI